MKGRRELRGRRVLITGGASGIGLATAWEFARRGSVPLLVDVNRFALEEAVSKLREKGYEVHAFCQDITDIQGVRSLARELEERGQTPDILVNCAGTTLIAHVSATTHEDWERIIGINLLGTVHIVETFLPELLEKGGGHIVNIGSLDGLVPIPSQAAYCASKFAITGMSESLYFDLKNRGVRVTLICPGAVNTPLVQSKPIRDIPIDFKGANLVSRLVKMISNSPEKIARHIAEAVVHGRFLVIPGLPSRIIFHFRRLFPRVASHCGVYTAEIFDLARKRHRLAVSGR
jgi:short-subunit dehydrogenase